MKFILAALTALFSAVNAEVIPFDNSAIEKIFQNKKSALFLFASDNDASTNAKSAFKALDEAGTDVVLTVSESNDGHGLFDRLAEYVGVNTQETPQILYLGEKQDKYIFEGEASQEGLATFLSKVQAGEVEQYLKSAPIPEPNDEPVKVLVGKTFKPVVLESDK